MKKKKKKPLKKWEFQPGNQLWQLRKFPGRKPRFSSPQKLWEAACGYFEWCEANPLQAAELIKYQGKAKVGNMPKMRAMTLKGLCLHMGVPHSTWQDYTEKDGFSAVTTRIEDIIYEQKFTGAAADLLNPNIIARDLGLADKTEHSGPGGGPIPVKEMSKNEIARRLAFALLLGLREGEKENEKAA